MPDETRILELLQEILESGRTAEAACADSPELISDVRERLQRCRVAEAQLDAMFPLTGPMVAASAYLRGGAAVQLPQIPGYQVESVLGRGGMGVVFRARHLKLGRWVALKMMLAGPYAGRDELGRFAREAEAIATLRHEHIVQVYDAGELDGCPYFTMEYVEGGTLAENLAATPQRAPQAAALVAKLATAVLVAHRAGILHRDLKPGNVLLTTDGTPKITDFGLARHLNGEPSFTLTGARMGTPSYMAPEQVTGKHEALGTAVDIYALGALLYEMLTGRPPFRGESASETERQVLSQEPISPWRLNPQVPRDLDTICLKCLQKDPSRRYRSAADLAADLNRFLSGKPIVARPVGAAERAVKWARRRPAFAGLLATLMLALAAAIVTGVRIQRQENMRRVEAAMQEGRAREAVETALSLVVDLRRSERWVEADHILQDAGSRLADAKSPQLKARFDRVATDLRTAQELDDIRQSYAQPNVEGYNFGPAVLAYQRLFARIGIGPEVPVETAAAIVRGSPICQQLLAGLENAAFVSRVRGGGTDLRLARALAIARLSDPDPSWGDRFRDPDVWRSADSLRKLVEDAGTSGRSNPAHQMVIIGVLLNDAGSNSDTIKVLGEAQCRNPSDFWLNLEMGNALYRARRNLDACQYYRAALAVRPDNYVLWTTLGAILRGAGESNEGLAAIRKAIDINPRYAMAWWDLIYALATAGQGNEAEKAFQTASRINPGDIDYLLSALAPHLVGDARSSAARQEWKAAAEAYAGVTNNKLSADSEICFEYAAVQLLLENRDEYKRTCQHMLKRCGEGAMRPFLVARVHTLAPCATLDLSRAAQLSSAELRAADAEPWSLTEQGALCYRSGQFRDAVPLFERSIAADDRPGAAVLNWLWLAMAHEKLGHPEEAKRWFTKATSWLDQLGPEIPPNSRALSFHLHNWLEAQILRREAAETIAE